MDDSFNSLIAFPEGADAGLSQRSRADLTAEAVAAIATRLSRPGKQLSLLDPDGVVLHDTVAPQGSAWASLWPKESQALIADAIDRAAGGANVSFELMATNLKDPDSLSWWRIALSPLPNADKTENLLIRALCEDITGQMDQLHRRSRPDWLPGMSNSGLQGRKDTV